MVSLAFDASPFTFAFVFAVVLPGTARAGLATVLPLPGTADAGVAGVGVSGAMSGGGLLISGRRWTPRMGVGSCARGVDVDVDKARDG
jgi:hypothetical protein